MVRNNKTRVIDASTAHRTACVGVCATRRASGRMPSSLTMITRWAMGRRPAPGSSAAANIPSGTGVYSMASTTGSGGDTGAGACRAHAPSVHASSRQDRWRVIQVES